MRMKTLDSLDQCVVFRDCIKCSLVNGVKFMKSNPTNFHRTMHIPEICGIRIQSFNAKLVDKFL